MDSHLQNDHILYEMITTVVCAFQILFTVIISTPVHCELRAHLLCDWSCNLVGILFLWPEPHLKPRI